MGDGPASATPHWADFALVYRSIRASSLARPGVIAPRRLNGVNAPLGISGPLGDQARKVKGGYSSRSSRMYASTRTVQASTPMAKP